MGTKAPKIIRSLCFPFPHSSKSAQPSRHSCESTGGLPDIAWDFNCRDNLWRVVVFLLRLGTVTECRKTNQFFHSQRC